MESGRDLSAKSIQNQTKPPRRNRGRLRSAHPPLPRTAHLPAPTHRRVGPAPTTPRTSAASAPRGRGGVGRKQALLVTGDAARTAPARPPGSAGGGPRARRGRASDGWSRRPGPGSLSRRPWFAGRARLTWRPPPTVICESVINLLLRETDLVRARSHRASNLRPIASLGSVFYFRKAHYGFFK